MTLRLLLAAALLCGCAPKVAFVQVGDAETGRALFLARVTTDRSDVIATTDSLGLCPYPEGRFRGAAVAVERPGFLPVVRPAGALRMHGETLLVSLYPDRPRSVRCEVVDSLTGSVLLGAVVRIEGTGDTAEQRLDGSSWFAVFPPGPQRVIGEFEGSPSASLVVTARGGETTEVRLLLRDTLDAGSVQGSVTDQASGEPLGGATITLEGLSLAGVTREDGAYLIALVPVGDRSAVVSCSGYESKRIRFPMVRGWSITVDVELSRVGAKPGKAPLRGGRKR